MILELCGEIVLRVVGSAVSGVVNAVVSRTGGPEGDEPRVSPNALAERRYAYRRWAELRIVFVPMVPTDLLDAPLDEMLRALAPRETHAYR